MGEECVSNEEDLKWAIVQLLNDSDVAGDKILVAKLAVSCSPHDATLFRDLSLLIGSSP